MIEKNKYLKYFTVIFSGGIVAQVIYFSTIPILSRLYSVEDFSKLSIFASLLIVLNSISCLRYDVAITLAIKKSDIFKLCLISFIIATFFSLFLLQILLIGAFLGVWEYFWSILGISVWLSSIFNIFLNYYLKQKEYKKVSSIKVSQVAAMSGFQIVVGYTFPKIGAIGLILGQMINYMIGGVFQIRKIIPMEKIRKTTFKNLKEVFIKYSNYLRFSTFDSIFNLLGLHLPIILLTFMYDKFAMGLLYMGMRFIQTPLSLIMSTVSQIYYSNVQDNLSKNLFYFTIKFVIYLTLIGLVGSLAYFIIGIDLIDIVLGKEWSGLAELSLWMIPWFFIQLISSPISTVMYAVNKHKEMMYLTLCGFIIRVFPLGFLLSNNNSNVIEILFYLFDYIFILCKNLW